jgi:hypothetical protein
MNELQRFKKLKELGYVYEPETGLLKRNGEARGSKNRRHGYIELSMAVEKKNYKVFTHRYIWWLIYNEIPNVIDHINRVKDDNRLVNLRNTTQQKNQFNTKAKGYYYNKAAKKYKAQIKIDRKLKYLGYYKTEQEAKQAYLDAKAIYHKI